MTLVLLLLTAGSAGAALGLLIARAHTRRLEAQLQRQRGIIQRMSTIDWYTDWFTEEAGSFPPPPSSAAALDRLIHEVWPHSRERWEDTSTWE